MVTTEDGEVFSWGLGRFGVLGRSYTDFTYHSDVGMPVPEGDQEEGLVQEAAAMPPPMPAADINAAVVEANGEDTGAGDEGVAALMARLDALNLVSFTGSELSE